MIQGQPLLSWLSKLNQPTIITRIKINQQKRLRKEQERKKRVRLIKAKQKQQPDKNQPLIEYNILQQQLKHHNSQPTQQRSNTNTTHITRNNDKRKQKSKQYQTNSRQQHVQSPKKLNLLSSPGIWDDDKITNLTI